jgi:hypothetical protein
MLTGYLSLGSVDESRLERLTSVWPPRHRLLATALFTDIVNSTSTLQGRRDWKWGVHQHQVIVRRELARVIEENIALQVGVPVGSNASVTNVLGGQLNASSIAGSIGSRRLTV